MTNSRKKFRDQEDQRKAVRNIQEILWIIESSRNISTTAFKDIMERLDDSLDEKRRLGNEKLYLVGVLPTFLNDFDIFPKNEDVARFSEDILKVFINRYDKRSRYEIIGSIILSVNSLSEMESRDLIDSITSIINSSNRRLKVIDSIKNNKSWGEIIWEISHE